MPKTIKNKIFYKYINKDPNSVLFIFLHGLMGSHEDWSILDPYITLPHALYIDIPGHGKSELAQNSSWEKCSRDLLNFIESFEGEKVLVGYSLGGRIALQLLANSPETFKSVICESASFGIEKKEQRDQRWLHDKKLFQDIKTREDFIGFLYQWYEMPLFEAMKNKDAVINKKSQGDFKQYSHILSLLSVGKQPYLFEKLLKLKDKIIYLAGTKDLKYMNISQKWSNKEGEVLHFLDASHNIHNDFPKEYSQVLKRFLD